MTPEQGRGVEKLIDVLHGLMKRLPRGDARSFIDGLTDSELADVMETKSAASLASGGTGNLLYESAAARLRGRDVEKLGSVQRALTTEELLRLQGVDPEKFFKLHHEVRAARSERRKKNSKGASR